MLVHVQQATQLLSRTRLTNLAVQSEEIPAARILPGLHDIANWTKYLGPELLSVHSHIIYVVSGIHRNAAELQAKNAIGTGPADWQFKTNL